MQEEAKELLAQLQANDARAQARLWSEQWSVVYSICARILGPGADATDVAVEVLTDFLYRYVHRLDRPRAIRAYLRLMASHRSIKAKARRARSEELIDEPQGEGASPEEVAERRALLARLDQCLAELTPKAVSVIKLRFADEMTNEKIGSLVGGSKQYIGKLLRRSLELLAACLERAA